MRNQRPYLFSKYDLGGTLENKFTEIQSEIERMGDDRLLNTSVSDMVSYLVEKHLVESIQLDESGITVDQDEAHIDVSGDSDRYIRDRSRPFHVKGTSNVFYVPFTGEADLFYCQPSTTTSLTPTGHIEGNELVLKYDTTEHDPEKLKNQFDQDLTLIKRYLGWIEGQVTSFNSSLEARAEQIVNNRRELILKNKGLASSLGFPMREKPGAARTYSVPEVKRKPPVRPPTASTDPFTPEPAINDKEYEHILSVIDNMVLVMERSPHAFAGMEEEDIRQHFLVQLNGQYEGQATGETFNFEGKTDILIRSEGKNIFIAECKFWRGPKSFIETIDQILGYTSWRDIKTAILVFNRNKNLSAVLEKIPEEIQTHSNFKRMLDYNREAGWRAIFHHNDDSSRELTLTIHVYEVPSEK